MNLIFEYIKNDNSNEHICRVLLASKESYILGSFTSQTRNGLILKLERVGLTCAQRRIFSCEQRLVLETKFKYITSDKYISIYIKVNNYINLSTIELESNNKLTMAIYLTRYQFDNFKELNYFLHNRFKLKIRKNSIDKFYANNLLTKFKK